MSGFSCYGGHTYTFKGREGEKGRERDGEQKEMAEGKGGKEREGNVEFCHLLLSNLTTEYSEQSMSYRPCTLAGQDP